MPRSARPASSRGRSGSSACSTSSRRSSTSTRSSSGAATTPTRPVDDRPFSSKNLLECYRRAEPHWERRDEVRARSDGPWKRGVGLASQIWYGGGGPPSYAWVRVGSDGARGRGHGDAGHRHRHARRRWRRSPPRSSGCRSTASTSSLGDSARGPYASISAGSSTTPSMGPAVRAAAADAKRQIARDRRAALRPRGARLSLKDGNVVSADGGSWPLEEIVGLLDDAQILGKGARGPNPTGMRCSRSASRWPRSPSTSRPARCGSSASPRSTTSAA